MERIFTYNIKLIFVIFIITLFGCSSVEIEQTKKQFSIKNVISNKNPHFGIDLYRYSNPRYQKSKNIESTLIISFSDTIFIKYDHSGNIISSISHAPFYLEENSQYDSKERLILKVVRYLDNNIDSIRTTYYKDSLVSMCLSERRVQYFDKKKNIISDVTYNKSNEITTSFKKEYDDNGNVVDFKAYGYDSLLLHEKYRYGKNNELIETKVINPGNEFSINVYDINGELILNGGVADLRLFTYNEEELIITERRYFDSGDSVIFKYQFDNHGGVIFVGKQSNSEVLDTIDYRKYLYDYFGNVIAIKRLIKGKWKITDKFFHNYYKRSNYVKI